MNLYTPVPFDLTYIVYDPADPWGLVCVHLSLFPIYNMVFYLSWFLVSREIEPVVVVGGHLVSEVANKCAKTLLKVPRPDFHKDFGHGALTFGMPSAHGQHMGFFSGYFVCVVLLSTRLPRFHKLAASAILLLTTIAVSFSRVYLLYHTCQQVVVGTTIGLVLGVGYFYVSGVLRDVGVVDWVLSWPLVRYFYIKDSYYHVYQTYSDEYRHFTQLKQRKVHINKRI